MGGVLEILPVAGRKAGGEFGSREFQQEGGLTMRTCDTCKKKLSERKCAALTEMIGRNGDCWSWTDDANWEKKVRATYQDYAGLKSNAGRKTYDADIGQIVELRRQGLTQYQIAKLLNISRTAVVWRLEKARREGMYARRKN